MKRTAVFISIAILFTLVTSLIAYKGYLQVVADIEGRFNTAQLVRARHIAHSIEGLAEGTKREMMIASLIPSIQKGDNRCLTEMQEIYEGLRGNIRCLYRLDENGNVTHVVPEERIREAEERGSDPDLKPLITAPVSYKGRPAGVIGAEIDLSSLIGQKTGTDMLLASMNGYSWAIDERGRFIFHPEEGFIGRDAFTVRKERSPHISFEEIERIMREKMMKGESGTAAYVSGWHRRQEGKIKKLIAYSPFRIGARHYSLALVTPASEVTSLTRENFRDTLLLIGIVILIGLIGLLVILYIDQQRMKHLEKEKDLGKEIKDSEERYRTLIEEAFDGIFVQRGARIVFANQRLHHMLGYGDGELVGMDHWLVYHPEYQDITRERGKARMRGEELVSRYEVKLQRKDGAWLYGEINAGVISFAGDPGVVVWVRDITERKQAEEEIRKKSEEIENFIYVVSHDLKAPLISLQGFSSLLLKNLPEKSDEKSRGYLKRIKANTTRIEFLISDLLALSRLGRAVSPFKDTPSHGLVQRVLSSLKPRLEENGIEVSLRDNLPTIRCDGERIYQVFKNLVANAIRFMGDTEKAKIEIGYEEKEGFHRFHVRDNGIGIDSRYHRKIFEILHRLKEVDDNEGTGIGLVIVERIITDHGGEVWVESEKGKGATFYFTLPNPDRLAKSLNSCF